MDLEAYKTLSALTGDLMESKSEAATIYNAPSMPAPRNRDEHEVLEKRLLHASKGFDAAENRLKLALVVLKGGFPEEVMRPVHQALGWALNGLLSLFKEHSPDDKLPSPRTVEAELVAPGHLPAAVAAHVERIRSLTGPTSKDEGEAPPPSLKAAEGFIAGVRELLDKGHELAAKEGL